MGLDRRNGKWIEHAETSADCGAKQVMIARSMERMERFRPKDSEWITGRQLRSRTP